MSQTEALIRYLETNPDRWISQLDAYEILRSTRLAARIQDAEELGYQFDTRDIRQGRKHWREYRLKRPAQRDLFAPPMPTAIRSAAPAGERAGAAL